jgi:hypothetical protein
LKKRRIDNILEQLGFAEALETFKEKRMQSLLKAIASCEFDQSLLSPSFFSIVF